MAFEAIVLVRIMASRQLVADRCPAAAAHGIRIGMTLAEARALCPGLRTFPHDPLRDQRALEALGHWLIRFSPIVSPAFPDTIFLDCTGCQRLYGSRERLVDRVATALKQLNLHARLAMAPTVGAAWAIASYAGEARWKILRTLDELPAALAPLPPAALRLEESCIALLNQVGIETIGQLMRLPRESLPARFGIDLLRQLDAATGKIAEPLDPLVPHCPVATHIEFEAPIDSLEILQQAVRALIGQLIPQLISRGGGVRVLQSRFQPMHSPAVIKTIHLSAPSRSASTLFNLLRCALETVHSDEGFISIHLSAQVVDRLTDAQLLLLDQEERDQADDLARLIEMLAARLGPRTIVRPQRVEAHLPEKTFRRVEAIGAIELSPINQAEHATVQLEQTAGRLRPLCLFPMPARILAVVSPSDNGDGKPVAFTHDGEVHRLCRAHGPERIAGPWWEGRDKTRDYFDVENEIGQRFWLFRVTQTGQWFLHGTFN